MSCHMKLCMVVIAAPYNPGNLFSYALQSRALKDDMALIPKRMQCNVQHFGKLNL